MTRPPFTPSTRPPRATPAPRRVAATAGALLAACMTAHAGGLRPESHVDTALDLVRQIDLAHTGYEHGPGNVDWTGTVASHTDCSGFVDHLLMHDDGLTPDDFRHWLGSRRPTAERYHDAIVAGRGFTPVPTVTALQPGDLIAIKYLTRHDNTGHVMLVVGAPARWPATPPDLDGTSQWAVPVVDSAESGHGPSDTRHRRGEGGRDHDGLGQGVFRLYADAQGRVVGFSWSTSPASHFVAPQDEHLVIGRLIPGFQP